MKERKGAEKRDWIDLACPFLHSWSVPLGHDGGDRRRCCPSKVISQAGWRWRSALGGFPLLGSSRVLGETGLIVTDKHKSEEESAGRCLDSVRGREWRGGEGFVPCVWVLGKKKGGFVGRERIHAAMLTVSLTWCSGSRSHKHYKFLSYERLEIVCCQE